VPGPTYYQQSSAPPYSGEPYQPPYYSPNVRPPPPYELAGFGARFAAYFVDSIILSVITMPASFFLNRWLMPDITLPLEQLINSLIVLIAIGALIDFIALIIYFTIQEGGKKNATLGKRLLKIRVADEYNRPIGTREAFIRNLGRFTFIPIFGSIILIIDSILILATDRQQRIGDRMAHTIVVRDSGYPFAYGPQYSPHVPYYQPPYQPSPQQNEPYRKA